MEGKAELFEELLGKELWYGGDVRSRTFVALEGRFIGAIEDKQRMY